jgi:DNA mismatch endonuclease Vsr
MDNLTAEQRKRNMQAIHSSGTLPERMVMMELKKRGIYFAPNVSTIIGKPDIVFRRKKVVVFIDSDFWHGHTNRFTMPKSNPEYWIQKIAGNRSRDREVNRELKKAGWKVIRLWESDVKRSLDRCILKVLSALAVY